jgi:hypothetical protein
MLGFKSFENARVVIAGIELAQKVSQRPCHLRRLGGTAAIHAHVWQRVMAASTPTARRSGSCFASLAPEFATELQCTRTAPFSRSRLHLKRRTRPLRRPGNLTDYDGLIA